mmetsp:Transcript_34501/g.103154  ORF Transcript_34501/g.103154 Transcript_34501/m.103154 type:complete len:121 (+) Transcript_34501:179-541(+)
MVPPPLLGASSPAPPAVDPALAGIASPEVNEGITIKAMMTMGPAEAGTEAKVQYGGRLTAPTPIPMPSHLVPLSQATISQGEPGLSSEPSPHASSSSSAHKRRKAGEGGRRNFKPPRCHR